MSEPIRKAQAWIPVSAEPLAEAEDFRAAMLDALTNPRPPRPPAPPPPLPAGHQLLLDHPGTWGALRLVVELHEPVWFYTRHVCEGCDGDGHDWEPPEWPCSTVELIAETLRVELPAVAR